MAPHPRLLPPTPERLTREGEAAGCIARGDGLKHLKVPGVSLLLIFGAVLLACVVAVALVRERMGWGAEEAEAAVAKLENLRRRLEA